MTNVPVKTALAPMFAIRALTVEGWYGTNILGNTDGQVLSYAENAASKVASKQGVLEGILEAGGFLLGRRTYEIFAAYWPYYDETAPDGGIARHRDV